MAPAEETWPGRVSLWLEPGPNSGQTVRAVMDFLAVRQAELRAFLALDPWHCAETQLPWAMEIGATTGRIRPLGVASLLRRARELERLIQAKSVHLAFKASVEQVRSSRDAGVRRAAESASLLILDESATPARDLASLLAAIPIPVLLASWRSLAGPVRVVLAGDEDDSAVLRVVATLRRERSPLVVYAPDPEASARTHAREAAGAEFRRSLAGFGLLRHEDGGLLVMHRRNPLLRMLPRLRKRFSLLLV